MKKLNFGKNKDNLLEIPFSISSLVELPSNQFNPNTWKIGNPWRECINKLIFRCIISLLLNNFIQVEYHKTTKKDLWGLVSRTKVIFRIISVHNGSELSKLSWFEKLFLFSIEQVDNDNSIQEYNLKSQLRMLMKSLFGEKGSFCNPWKKIVEKIMLNDCKKYLNYNIDNSLFTKWYYLDIDWKSRLEYKQLVNNIDDVIKNLTSNEMNQKFILFLEKNINESISERQDLD